MGKKRHPSRTNRTSTQILPKTEPNPSPVGTLCWIRRGYGSAILLVFAVIVAVIAVMDVVITERRPPSLPLFRPSELTATAGVGGVEPGALISWALWGGVADKRSSWGAARRTRDANEPTTTRPRFHLHRRATATRGARTDPLTQTGIHTQRLSSHIHIFVHHIGKIKKQKTTINRQSNKNCHQCSHT